MNLLVAIRAQQIAFVGLRENFVPGTIRQVAKIQIEVFSQGLQVVKFKCGEISVVTALRTASPFQIDQVDLSLSAAQLLRQVGLKSVVRIPVFASS
jgi:hypothetical protein